MYEGLLKKLKLRAAGLFCSFVISLAVAKQYVSLLEQEQCPNNFSSIVWIVLFSGFSPPVISNSATQLRHRAWSDLRCFSGDCQSIHHVFADMQQRTLDHSERELGGMDADKNGPH